MSPVIADTTVSALEQAILGRLEAKITGLEIDAFPDQPKRYRLRHQVGALLVAYRGADYSALRDTGDVVRERTLSFDVHVLSRSLSGHKGAYTHLEAARLALSGHKVPGFFRPIQATRERFIGQGDGVWTFALTVAAATIAAEVEDDDELGALLERITLEGEHTTTEVTSG